MDEEEEYHLCPLCVEEMDLQDKNFLPCPCGYRVCRYFLFIIILLKISVDFLLLLFIS